MLQGLNDSKTISSTCKSERASLKLLVHHSMIMLCRIALILEKGGTLVGNNHSPYFEKKESTCSPIAIRSRRVFADSTTTGTGMANLPPVIIIDNATL